MLLASAPGVIAITLLLVAPGLIWAWWCYPAPDAVTRLAVGLGIGVAFQMHISALLAAGPGITGVSVAAATVCGGALATVLAWRSRRPRIPRLSRRTVALSAQIAGVVAATTTLRLVPLAFQEIPRGWDPSFHSLLASTTVATGRLPTWAPFEPIPSNYPYGPHVLMAQITLVSGIPVHVVFAVLLNGVVPAATGLALYAFGRRVLQGHGPALASVAAYGLLGYLGSIDYGGWGGLPNALGFFLVLVVLTVLFTPGFDWWRVIVGGVLLGAVPLAHHHVLLTTVLLLAAYTGYLAWRWTTHKAARPVTLRAARRLAATGVVAVLSVAYYLVPFAARALEVPDTSVLRYTDHDFSLAANGVLLWALALAGAPLVDRRRGVRRGDAGASGRARAFVVAASATLLLAYLLGYYGYRAYSLRRYHQPYTAFTPSRFLTDLTLFLALYAGIPLAALWRLGARDAWQTSKLAKLRLVSGPLGTLVRMSLRATLVLVLAVTGIVFMWQQLLPAPGYATPGHLAAGEAAAFAWVRMHTPSNTLVMNLDPNARWAPYFTQREVWQTPVPVSEFTGGYVAEKRHLGEILLANLASLRPGSQTHIVALAAVGAAQRALVGRPLAVLTDHAIPGLDGSPMFAAGPEQVYTLPDAGALLASATSAAATIQWWPQPTTPPLAGWEEPGGATIGWAPDAPPASQGGGQTVFVRIALASPVSASARIACGAGGAATLYVDGRATPDGCAGRWVDAPALAGPGPHLIAVRAALGQGLGPWFHVAVMDGPPA